MLRNKERKNREGEEDDEEVFNYLGFVWMDQFDLTDVRGCFRGMDR